MTDSAVTSGVYTIQCAAPTFSPAAGTYSSAQSVTISTTTSGATIRYTTDGSTPSETAGTVYSSAVNISANTTLQAIAYKTGMADSPSPAGVYYHPVRHPDLQPGGRHLWLRAIGDHQHHHQRGDHPLYHRRQHADARPPVRSTAAR